MSGSIRSRMNESAMIPIVPSDAAKRSGTGLVTEPVVHYTDRSATAEPAYPMSYKSMTWGAGEGLRPLDPPGRPTPGRA